MKRQANKMDENESGEEMPGKGMKRGLKKPIKSYKSKIKARVAKKMPLNRK